jgi:orotidine-5'-phosphate decarboxylase
MTSAVTSPFEAEAERKLIVALDLPNVAEARAFWHRLELPNAVCKIGIELLYSGGIDLVREFSRAGVTVFVDAKLFDIGNTVERATARIAALGAAFLTVHAQDRQTVKAAARGRGTSELKLLGITLLTSAEAEGLREQGISLSASELVLRRAAFAADAGFDGVVSSPLEARPLRAAFGGRLSIVCPGIRPHIGQIISGDDQARTGTPSDAIHAGADYVVVGRPILRAADPAGAARAIVAEIASALREIKISESAIR